jgi:hypothetical protein
MEFFINENIAGNVEIKWCRGGILYQLLNHVIMMTVSLICDPNQWVLWEVDNIDGNASNNDISNLRWVLGVTNKDNYNSKN